MRKIDEHVETTRTANIDKEVPLTTTQALWVLFKSRVGVIFRFFRSGNGKGKSI